MDNVFAMDDHEIRMSYENAVDKKEQISILADLNATDVWSMMCKLVELGCTVDGRWYQAENPKRKANAEEKDRRESDKLAEENARLVQKIAALNRQIDTLRVEKRNPISDELWYLSGAVDAALRMAASQVNTGRDYLIKLADQMRELIWENGGEQ